MDYQQVQYFKLHFYTSEFVGPTPFAGRGTAILVGAGDVDASQLNVVGEAVEKRWSESVDSHSAPQSMSQKMPSMDALVLKVCMVHQHGSVTPRGIQDGSPVSWNLNRAHPSPLLSHLLPERGSLIPPKVRSTPAGKWIKGTVTVGCGNPGLSEDGEISADLSG